MTKLDNLHSAYIHKSPLISTASQMNMPSPKKLEATNLSFKTLSAACGGRGKSSSPNKGCKYVFGFAANSYGDMHKLIVTAPSKLIQSIL